MRNSLFFFFSFLFVVFDACPIDNEQNDLWVGYLICDLWGFFWLSRVVWVWVLAGREGEGERG